MSREEKQKSHREILQRVSEQLPADHAVLAPSLDEQAAEPPVHRGGYCQRELLLYPVQEGIWHDAQPVPRAVYDKQG